MSAEQSSPPVASEAPKVLSEMSLREHLVELRRRLIISVIVIAIGTVAGMYLVESIFPLLTNSFHEHFTGALLVGTSPSEAFILKLKVAFFAGLLMVSPVLFFQVWLFIAPGLYSEEKKWAVPFVLITTLLFLSGVTFCYEVVLPVALEFFASEYKSVGIVPTIKVSEHIAMVTQALIGFGVAFELPVISFLLARLGVLDYAMMRSGFRYAVVLIFIVAAILTPPDVLSQFLMAGPLMILYGISMLVVRATNRGTPLAKS